MRKRNLITIAIAGAVFAGGSALAQNTMPANPQAGAAGSAMQEATLSQVLVGKDVVNAQGKEIGEIEIIVRNQAVVSVGGFLGIGERKVVFTPQQLVVRGEGADATVATNLTDEQIKLLPSYKAAIDSHQNPDGTTTRPGGKMDGEGTPANSSQDNNSSQRN